MDRKMKFVYAGLMVLLMLGASVGTVVADTMNYAILIGNDELAQAAASASTMGGLLTLLPLIVSPATAWFIAGYFTTTAAVYA